ncbi:MAG: hypothetical protein KF773_03520 [Deltaproteobacteria bacterium]|nr:hypothetical protein [Deltaproteobacteria bacterium]MCW5801642.1 hypothetical protein [Deltaproteobacteria bacterium]
MDTASIALAAQEANGVGTTTSAYGVVASILLAVVFSAVVAVLIAAVVVAIQRPRPRHRPW